MHKKICVIGDKDSVLAFQALGVTVLTPIGAEMVRNAVDGAVRDGHGVVFITEQLAQLIPETIERYKTLPIPAVILIPSNQGTLGIGMAEINRNVEKAVGTNIL